MALAALLPFIPAIKDVLERFIPDPEERAKALAEMEDKALAHDVSRMNSQSSVITAEAKGESWMQRNWRPMLMLTFGFIIFNNHVLAPYLHLLFSVEPPMLQLSERMWDLLALGVGGYITGRSVEKVAKTVTERRSGSRRE